MFYFKIFFVVLFFGFGLSSSLDAGEDNSDYIKDLPDVINIHFVPHTHDDVGWLKTVDQYFYGRNESIQKACVECIIDNVIEALEKNSNRRFIYVETAFLWKWWQDRNETQRNVLKNLVDEGRLEIIGGGWSMNDEAVTHYQCVIDQLTWGFRRLNDMFGSEVKPRIGWQIDPFGHSREQASIFAQMGFDAVFFARIDYQDKSERLLDQTAEFIWRGSPSLGESADLFTSVLFKHYSPPPGFCFDVLCHDEEITDENIDRRASDLLEHVEKQARSFRTKNVLLTMGDDFHYSRAERWFENMDKLIDYINRYNSTRFKALYSTPSYYIQYLNEQNILWPEKSDDFFPYASARKAYWTGYYTSRPTLKFFDRLGNNFLQVLKQMLVITDQPDMEELQVFREAMGVMQHHDAVTGTEKQHVAEDYEKILYESFKNGEDIAEYSLNKLIGKSYAAKPIELHSCFLLNISSCEYSSDNEKFVVTVYNPTSQPLTTFVRLPIGKVSYTVKDYTGEELVTQIVPIPTQVLEIPGRESSADHELIFEAKNIPALSYKSFYVTEVGRESHNLNSIYSTVEDEGSIEGEYWNVGIDNRCRVSVRSKETNKQIDFKQSFHYYESHQYGIGTHSGAYVFRPQMNSSIELSRGCTYKIFKGPLVQEIHQKVNEWVSQVIRIYENKDHVEFEWLVGPIFTRDGVGKEIITRYASNLENEGEFYTDSNGREMLKRKLNYRPTWDVRLEEEISGNYYPVTTKIYIEDKLKNLRLSVLTDRAQGGSSLQIGDIELMLHRRLLRDDYFGVGEFLREDAYGRGLVVRGQHYLVGGSLMNRDELALKEKNLASELAMRPWILITPTKHSFDGWNESYKMKGDMMIYELPKNVRILTLEPWRDGEVLLRLEHIFEKDEAPNYSIPVEISLKNLFAQFVVQSVIETTLGGNQLAKNAQRLKWRSSSNSIKDSENSSEDTMVPDDLMVVTLKPMEIKTFIIKLLYKADLKLRF